MPTTEEFQFMERAETELKLGVVAIELSAHFGEGAIARAEAEQHKSINEDLAFALNSRIADLDAKRRDAQMLQAVIAQQPRCK
jgi:hypothetical protein